MDPALAPDILLEPKVGSVYIIHNHLVSAFFFNVMYPDSCDNMPIRIDNTKKTPDIRLNPEVADVNIIYVYHIDPGGSGFILFCMNPDLVG